jgi:16S rRNA (adenine1518-N6/adenine1519-N6)-dimethyltransferase
MIVTMDTPPAVKPTEEIFDITDLDDRVIGQLPRSEVHRQKLWHRAAHIFVFNNRGEILVHRRSAQKDEYPLRITSSASGHLSAGEDYPESAQRELAEELGLTGPLEFLVKLPASPDMAYEHSALFKIITDDVPIPDPGEICEVFYLTVTELNQRIAANPDDFTPPFLRLWAWYCYHRHGSQ